MTETKLNGLTIHNIDSKDTYDALVAAGEIGEDDLALVKEDASAFNLGITGANVGDIVKVKAVDESGKPTEWVAAEYDGWTKIGELTMGGTVFPITAYADGIITVTPQDGVYPTVQQNRILRKPDYSAYENVQLVATETAGQYSMKNLDGQTYAPSDKDFTQYVLEEPEAMLLTFTNTPAFAYHKARFTTPLMPCHGMRGSFASTYSGLHVYDVYVYNMGVQSGCEIWLENDATYDPSKICVRASYFSGKGGAGDHNQVRIVNKPTIPTSIGFRNESAVLAINSKVELWGRN